jgi:hypothetical protein
MNPQELENIYAIQDYFNKEIQKRSHVKESLITRITRKPKSRINYKVRYFYRTNDNFLVSNRECNDEIKLLYDMVDDICSKSNNSIKIVNYLVSYYTQKIEDTTENSPRQAKAIKALIYVTIGIVAAQIFNSYPVKDSLKFVASISSSIVLFVAFIQLSIQIYNDTYLEYDLFPNLANYRLILKALNLAKEEITSKQSP